MPLGPIEYALGEALRSLKRSGWGGLASVATIAASFFIVGAFLLVASNLSAALSHWREQVQVSVFLKDHLSSAQISSLKEKLSAEKGIKAFTYVTKEEALADFKRDLKGQDGLLEGLGYNPLPASFRIQVMQAYQSPERLQELVRGLGKLEGVEDVLYGQESVERISLLIRWLKVAGLALGIPLLLASILIVSNTIRLDISRRAEEIEVMRLVGASWAYIRSPFLFLGMIQGLLGATFALLLLFAVYHVVLWQARAPLAASLGLPGLQFLLLPHLLLTLLAGILIGGGGGLLSIKRFLGR